MQQQRNNNKCLFSQLSLSRIVCLTELKSPTRNVMLYDSSLSMIKVMYTISRSNNRKRYSRNSRLKKGRANRFLDTQNCDTNIRLRMPNLEISKSRIQLQISKLPLFQTDTLKLAFNEQVFILFQYGTHFFYHETKILLFVDVPQNGFKSKIFLCSICLLGFE